MSKHIIDLRPDCKVVQQICELDGQVYIGSKGVNYLEELNSDYINEHYGDLQDTAYQKGFEDGKAVNDKGCEGCKYSGTPQGDSPCFNCSNYYTNNWTAKQTDDEIKVGDEVVDSSGKKGLVVSDGNKCSDTIWLLINGYRVPQSVCKEDYTKTGRHFDIDKILEAMKA